MIERNSIKEMKRRDKGIDWEDDEDQYQFIGNKKILGQKNN